MEYLVLHLYQYLRISVQNSKKERILKFSTLSQPTEYLYNKNSIRFRNTNTVIIIHILILNTQCDERIIIFF